MTAWNHDVDPVEARRIRDEDQTCIVAYDKRHDYQKGDTFTFTGEGKYAVPGTWTITHVSKNQNGITHEYAVLSLRKPDADYYERRAKTLSDLSLRQSRRIAALRGQITKLRNRIEAGR